MLAGGILGFGVNMKCSLKCMIVVNVVNVVVIALEVAVPVSYATDVRAGMMIGVLAAAVVGVVPDSGVDVLAGVDANMWAVTTNALESIPMLA